MDLSKLPKLSETKREAQGENAGQQTPAPGAPAQPARPVDDEPRRPRASGAGLEAWISTGVGVILLLAYPRMLKFISSRLFGTFFAPYMLNGKEVPYTSTPDFWSDLGITWFAAALVVDGVVVALRRRPAALLLACALMGSAAMYNLGYLVLTYQEQGLALVSALGVVFGGYVAYAQWGLYQRLREAA